MSDGYDVYKAGDRVRVVKVNWEDPTEDELAIIGQEGTVVPHPANSYGLFIRVDLDEVPAWWASPQPMPFVADELELVK